MAAERGRSSTSHATQVCYVCKARKKKCNKLLPSCGYCVRKGLFCEYGLKAQDNSNPLLHSASLQPEAAIVEATALHRKVLELIRGTGYFVDDLSARYFQTLHSYLPVICRTTFHRSLTTLGAIPSAGFSVLLLIVCLAASASPKPAWNIRRAAFKPAVNPRALYLATKSILAQVQVGFPPSVQLIQARLLLALYEYEHGQPEDAFDSIAGCARMAYAARLQNPNSAALVQSSDLNNMPSKPDIAAQMHKEEAANTWWGIVICERISYCEIALSEQPLITTIPVDDSGLPTEPETMEYGESEGLETAPVIAVSFLNSPGIGGFGRSAQSAWLLDKVITAVEVPDIHARLVQLEKLDSILQKFLSSLLKQQEQKAVAFCEAIAITIRALIILHNHVLHVLRHSRTSISPTFGARGEWPAHSQAALDATTTIILDIIDIHEGFDSVAPSFSYIVQASLEYVRSKPNWKDNSWYCSAEARLRCSLDKFHQVGDLKGCFR